MNRQLLIILIVSVSLFITIPTLASDNIDIETERNISDNLQNINTESEAKRAWDDEDAQMQLIQETINESGEFILRKNVEKREQGLAISGNIPMVVRIKDATLQKNINELINEIYTRQVARARETKARTLNFDFYSVKSNDIYSLIVLSKATASFPISETDTVNFDLLSGKRLSLKDVLGINGVQLINKYVSDIIKSVPEKYNQGYQGLTDNQDFYVDSDSVVLIFNEGEIAPVMHGIIEFNIKLSNIKTKVLTKKDYYTKEGYYELKMIPLRQVCESFGYNVSWGNIDDMGNQSINIEKDGLFTLIEIGTNNYIIGKNTARSLESAPELLDGATYVPISFFDVVLGLTYSVDDNGEITFSRYDK